VSRILAIDYGIKKCGLAVTDPLKIIVNGLDTVATTELQSFITDYAKSESVEEIVFGRPVHKDGKDTYLVEDIIKVMSKFKTLLPDISFQLVDERMTSVLAKKIILQSGAKKKERQKKELVDKISAVVILQQFLGHI
jgi:putative holliday junction resolvase